MERKPEGKYFFPLVTFAVLGKVLLESPGAQQCHLGVIPCWCFVLGFCSLLIAATCSLAQLG